MGESHVRMLKRATDEAFKQGEIAMRERCADVVRKKMEHYGEGYERLLQSCIDDIYGLQEKAG